jgi:hypothetical protein
MTEKRQTSQGYIIRFLQHFATKLWNITNFVMLFQAVMKFLDQNLVYNANGPFIRMGKHSKHKTLKAKAKMMFKILHNMGPNCLKELFTFKKEILNHNLCDSSGSIYVYYVRIV